MHFQKRAQEKLVCWPSLKNLYLRIYFLLFIVLFIVLKYINYGIMIRGSSCKLYLSTIFKQQMQAIRAISNSHNRCHTGPYFSNMIFLTFIILISSTLVYLCINTIQISYQVITLLIFTKHTQTHNYSTWNAQDYTINKTKKAFSDRAYRNCGLVFRLHWTKLYNRV